MILEVVKYGHPALRQKGSRVEKITPDIQKLIADMFETMQAAKGVGLAAPQVGRALQLTVLDMRGSTERPSTLELDGQEADVAAFMPLVLINPKVKGLGDDVAGSEGCLSFPEIFAEIARPGRAEVKATNQKGEAIQHELDHLNGVLFIDRMTRADKDELKPQLDELRAATKAALKANKK
jgi:peptide deformylase